MTSLIFVCCRVFCPHARESSVQVCEYLYSLPNIFKRKLEDVYCLKERRQGMPWYKLPKKDVNGRDSRRVGAIILLSDGFRMGKPTRRHSRVPTLQVLAFGLINKVCGGDPGN